LGWSCTALLLHTTERMSDASSLLEKNSSGLQQAQKNVSACLRKKKQFEITRIFIHKKNILRKDDHHAKQQEQTR
jgi:hypothetical protein